MKTRVGPRGGNRLDVTVGAFRPWPEGIGSRFRRNFIRLKGFPFVEWRDLYRGRSGYGHFREEGDIGRRRREGGRGVASTDGGSHGVRRLRQIEQIAVE